MAITKQASRGDIGIRAGFGDDFYQGGGTYLMRFLQYRSVDTLMVFIYLGTKRLFDIPQDRVSAIRLSDKPHVNAFHSKAGAATPLKAVIAPLVLIEARCGASAESQAEKNEQA